MEQMTEKEWFDRLAAHRAKNTKCTSTVDRMRAAMNWWNKLPTVDQQAQSEVGRTVASIMHYYWADTQS